MRTGEYSLKGPPVAGNPEIETWTLPPVPLEFAFTATAPRTVVSVLLGSIAMYCVPIGLFFTMGASLEGSPVEGTSLGASLLGVVGALGVPLLGAFTVDGSVLVACTDGESPPGVSGLGVSAAGASGLSAAGVSGVADGSSAGGGSAASGAAGASSAGASSCAKARMAKSARNNMRKRMVGVVERIVVQ
jgi:hypothetical protein